MSSAFQKNPLPSSEKSEEEILRGIIKRVTFQSSESGYCVLQVETLKLEGLATVVGNLSHPQPGQEIVARGHFEAHPKYGNQFKAYSLATQKPSSPEGIRRYLANTTVKGIGEKFAEKIIEAFGEKAMEIIVQQPEKVSALKGVSPSKVEALRHHLLAQKASDEVRRFLIENELSPRLAERITEKYGARAIEKVQENPYLLSRTLKGIGFSKADEIAMKVGVASDSPKRIEAALMHTLASAEDDGHCFLPSETLFERMSGLLALYEEGLFKDALKVLERRELIISENDDVYRKEIYEKERYVAREILRRLSLASEKHKSDGAINQTILKTAQDMGLEFSAEQITAVEQCFQYAVHVITGGPGCGKTTVTRAITQVAKSLAMNVALCAPTGKAAQRMSTVCLHPASTIHRMLKYNPAHNEFIHNARFPLELEGRPIDLLIVDESSMLDIHLLSSLVEALPENCHIIFVGDKDQLPSVGPGTVLMDLIRSQSVPVSTLSRLYRRDEASVINDIAVAINAGIAPDFPVPDGKTKTDVYFIERDSSEDAQQTIEKLCSEQIPKKFNIPPEHIAVLTPTNRGPLGTVALNRQLQLRLNPQGEEITLGNQGLKIGDRVCQRVNNYNIDSYGVFNGDNGVVIDTDYETGITEVELWDGRLISYKESDLSQLTLAYATTVHRAQGSEVPCVILALHTSHYVLLERQLLYTAVTRAKQLLIIVGSKRAIQIGCQKQSAKLRFTHLHTLLANGVEGSDISLQMIEG